MEKAKIANSKAERAKEGWFKLVWSDGWMGIWSGIWGKDKFQLLPLGRRTLQRKVTQWRWPEWARTRFVNGIEWSSLEQPKAILLGCSLEIPDGILFLTVLPAREREALFSLEMTNNGRKCFPPPRHQANLMWDFCWQCHKPREVIGNI